MKQVIYGFTFHPKFKDNGYVFVTWIPEPGDGISAEGLARLALHGQGRAAGHRSGLGEDHLRMAQRRPQRRLHSSSGPTAISTSSPATAPASPISYDIGQDLSSILAKLLRIDVDNPPPSRAVSRYGIPKDNPFVKTRQGARPEVYAYGLRQLWRFSFDRKTGDLWGGEVGQDLWEMIYKIEKGGNYGWSVMEGTHPFRPERKKGPTPILKPVVEHSHTRLPLDHRRVCLSWQTACRN